MGLAPSFTITAAKSGSNPTFAFDAIPENIVKVGSTYWCVYQGTWSGTWDVRLASAASPAGPWTAYASNPILTAGSQTWEIVGITPRPAAPELVYDGGTFYLFYSVLDASDDSDGRIGVATATSVTGPYTKYTSNPILSYGSAGEWDEVGVTFPSVIHDARTSQWVMAYTGYSATTQASRIGVATASSPTGPWTKATNNPLLGYGSSGAWDDAVVSNGHIFWDNGFYWILYSGNGSASTAGARVGLAYATSPTGIWTRYSGNPLLALGGAGAFDEGAVIRGSVYLDSGTYHVVYGGFDAGLTTPKGGNAILTAVGGATSAGVWIDMDAD